MNRFIWLVLVGFVSCDLFTVDDPDDVNDGGLSTGGGSGGGSGTGGGSGSQSPGTALVRGQHYPKALAVDSSTVFWMNNGNPGEPGSIMSVSKSGGTPTTLVASIADPQDLVIDSTFVYWAEGKGGLKRISKTGGSATTLATSSLGGITTLAVDATHVFFIDLSNSFGTSKLMKVPLTGGTPEELASAFEPLRIAVDTTHVYITAGPGALRKVAKLTVSGGAVTLYSTSTFGTGLAVDSASVYWASATENKILKLPLSGGATPTVVAENLVGVQDLIIDGVSAYGVNTAGGFPGTVFRVPLAGGARVNIAEGQLAPTRIASDGSALFWVNYNGGEVMRASK